MRSFPHSASIPLLPPTLTHSPAVFPPSFAALPPPMLEQFDLDVAFASPSTRLGRLLHKCYQDKPPARRRGAGREEEVEEAVDDLVYFVREAAEVSEWGKEGGRERGREGKRSVSVRRSAHSRHYFCLLFHIFLLVLPLTCRLWASPFLLSPRRQQQCRVRRSRKRERGRSGPSASSRCLWTSLPAGRERTGRPGERQQPSLCLQRWQGGGGAAWTGERGAWGCCSSQLVCVTVLGGYRVVVWG